MRRKFISSEGFDAASLGVIHLAEEYWNAAVSRVGRAVIEKPFPCSGIISRLVGRLDLHFD